MAEPRHWIRTGLASCLALALAGCAHRSVTVVSDPPGAFVALYPRTKMTTVTPGQLAGLQARRNYTIRLSLKGYDTTYAAIPPAPGLPWPVPINFFIQWAGGYDSSVEVKLRPCTDPSGCLEDEEYRR
jgi:hypothetical protein